MNTLLNLNDIEKEVLITTLKRQIAIWDDQSYAEHKLARQISIDIFNRKDVVIKRELFDRYIRDNYQVLFVLDDRNQVVDMWRELGLKCLQVAPGDF